MREAERKRVISSSATHSRKHPHECACRHMCRARLRASESPDDAVVVVFHWPTASNVKLLLEEPRIVVVAVVVVVCR